tara:strand:+ start:6224 stop:6658 length:435 start_codon:yes stop_codon:yes gene_type:complete
MKFFTTLIVTLCFSAMIQAHCQIPCGIYDDKNQFDDLFQHVQTIEKSVKQLLSENLNQNQTVRWVTNKEDHATMIQDVMNHYFLSQRIKPVVSSNKKESKRYVELLKQSHAVIRLAMKTKQTVDLNNVKVLNEAITRFQITYTD